jgi:hypothetical protein
MQQLQGCASTARFLVLALVSMLTVGVVYLLEAFGPPPQPPSNGGVTITSSTSHFIPRIPDEHFASGSASGSSTGDVSMVLALPIDRDKAYAQDGLGWIAFGTPGSPLAILITLDEPENSVAISNNVDTARGVDAECDFDITVTGDQVSGRIQCPNGEAWRNGRKIGKASIDVSFTASP